MPRHADFEKIYQAFMWRYCKSQGECEEGKNVYYAWLNKMGLDDTKPYTKPQEKFSWVSQSALQLLKEDEQAKYFKVDALFPITSMNFNAYTRDELMKACRTLIRRPVNMNHTQKMLPEVQIIDADYEDDGVECVLRVAREGETLQMIEKGDIVHVSIEADCIRGLDLAGGANMCKGLVFTGLALLTKDVLPGVPLTKIEPIERIIESFTVTDGNEMEEQKQEKQEDQTRDSAVESSSPQSPAATQEKTTTPHSQNDSKETERAEAEWDAAYINNLDDSCFAYIEPGGEKDEQGKTTPRNLRHLPFKNKNGNIDLPHLRNALARLDQTDLSDDAKKKALMNLCAAAKEVGLESDLCKEAAEQKQSSPCPETAESLIARIAALEKQIIELAKPNKPEKHASTPEVLTKEGFWKRFHQLRSEGFSKSDAFRLVSLELLDATKPNSD